MFSKCSRLACLLRFAFVCLLYFFPVFHELPSVALNSCAMCIYHGVVEELCIITATVALRCGLSENLQMLVAVDIGWRIRATNHIDDG